MDETRDHILGPLGAPITLVEYGSYACPHCRAANEALATLRDKFGEDYGNPSPDDQLQLHGGWLAATRIDLTMFGASRVSQRT